MADEKTTLSIYVIMPFSKTSDTRTVDYWNEHFTDFIQTRISEVTENDLVLSGFDWSVVRSSAARGGPLNYEIVWDLMGANIVLADITDLNPNVLYELGIRHALSAAVGSGRTIMIQDETAFKLPFDFANYATIKYRRDKVDSWKRDLADRLKGCVSQYFYRDNPVSMTFAQHNFSLQRQATQDKQMAALQSALDVVARMKDLGFSVPWIQDLISRSIIGNPPSPVVEGSTTRTASPSDVGSNDIAPDGPRED